MLNQNAVLDRAFQALADPTRRALIARLALGPATVSDLARPLPMSMQAVLQHLSVLEESGLVATRKVGRVRMCRIEPRRLSEAEGWINAQRAAWERRLDRLGDYLTELQAKGANDDPKTS